MFISLLRRFYHTIPLSANWRYRIGHWRRHWTSALSGRATVHYHDGIADAPTIDVVDFTERSNAHPDYFFFGVIDWHFRHQRPQQLAMALARTGRRVFYVSVNFVNRQEAGYSLEQLSPGLALYQVSLFVHGPLNVYTDMPEGKQLEQLKASLSELWIKARCQQAVHVIQHPFWHPVASFYPAARVLYDCMDHHAGFSNTAPHHAELEKALLQSADYTITTSDFLAGYAARFAKRVKLIRNASDFQHFSPAARRAVQQDEAGPVIGYYGAIAEWFDLDLLIQLATHFSDCRFILIGADTIDAESRLRALKNVQMPGEKPYAELPEWLARFDVCLIPFQINDLTLATNPVKVYEYLSAGKPVVGTALPELQKLDQLVYVAHSTADFITHLGKALAEKDASGSGALTTQRIDYARQQTWELRTVQLMEIAENRLDGPLTSVIVISYNQWHLTRRCLDSVLACSDGPVEIIVVDNASHDETLPQLVKWSQENPEQRILIANNKNLGFPAAVNQGLVRAQGDFLVILNNDTIVTPGFLQGLRRHFERHPQLGLICPVTNNIGNEAKIVTRGDTPGEIIASSRPYCMSRAGEFFELPSSAAFFCVMLPRPVFQKVGLLDEQFFPGFFEDDDYCLRIREAGWSIACAEDVFVFHELSASFNQEGLARKKEIFDRNQKLFEEKWGKWQPHTYRQ